MKKTSLILLITLLTAGTIFLTNETKAQSSSMPVWLDYASFDYPPEEGKSLVEFYYGILRHNMTFAYVEAGSETAVDTGYQASAEIWIEIEKQDGVIVDTLYKKIATFVKNPQSTTNKSFKITDQISVPLPPGEYNATLIVDDVESRSPGVPMSGKFGQRSIKVTVPNYNNPDLMLSGIELAYKINLLPEETTLEDYTPIDKSNRRVVPNPIRMFVDEDSVMYYYAEVYNLIIGPDVPKEYYVECKLLDINGILISNFGKRQHIKPGKSALVSNVIDIHDMPEGSYQLYLKVTDAGSGYSVEGYKPFQLLEYQPENIPTRPSDSFTEADAELLEKVLHYSFSTHDRDILEDLSLAGKKEFFEDYFTQRDPDPTTAENEYKIEMFQRFYYANQHFSVSIANKDDGWRSDKGRIWIKYGAPDEIHEYPYELEEKPYEIWEYNSLERQSGVYFVFVDEGQYGDYQLVHSNMKGERYDPNWADKIDEGGTQPTY